MYNKPEFVKWADEEIIEKAKQNVLAKYGLNGLVNINTADLSLDELMELTTFYSEIGYDEELYETISYEDRKKLKEMLNNEFDLRLGSFLDIYNLLDKKHNTEKWNGEMRHQLMALHNRKGYSEMSILKNVVWFNKMNGKIITIENAKELNSLMSHTLYWSFGCENSKLSFDENEENFKICNAERVDEINAQNAFVKCVLSGKMDEAFEMIKSQLPVEYQAKYQ